MLGKKWEDPKLACGSDIGSSISIFCPAQTAASEAEFEVKNSNKNRGAVIVQIKADAVAITVFLNLLLNLLLNSPLTYHRSGRSRLWAAENGSERSVV